MDSAGAGGPPRSGGNLPPELKDAYYLLWRELDIPPWQVRHIPDWALELAWERLPIWLVRLYAGTDPEAKKGAGGATNVRTITFAQAVAEGIIPPSGDAMSGPLAGPEPTPEGLADSARSR